MHVLSLEELLAPDDRTLRFSPSGLLMSSTLTPQAAVRHQQLTVASADLAPAVPDDVKQAFERLRRCQALGVVWYEAFTVAGDLSYAVLEASLRARFVEFYSGLIPLSSTQGPLRLHIRSFDDLADQFATRGRRDGCKLETSDGTYVPLPITLNPLLRWARRERLLAGQRNKVIELVLARLRNRVAHGGHHLATPVDSARDIRDLAEIINRLWGHHTPGGRLHPAPLGREAIVVGWRGNSPVAEQVRFAAEQLAWSQPEGQEDWKYLVLLAVPGDEFLLQYDNRFEATSYPCRLLWGPGDLADAQSWWSEADTRSDQVTFQDREFAIRVVAGVTHQPRRMDVAAALGAHHRTGLWHVVRADFPADAWSHVAHATQDVHAGVRRECACPVETLRVGDWKSVLADQASLDAPLPQFIVRVPQFHEG